MFDFFPLISFACSLIFFVFTFAWSERALTQRLCRSQFRDHDLYAVFRVGRVCLRQGRLYHLQFRYVY